MVASGWVSASFAVFPHTYIHEVETGQHGVRTEEFIAIAEALNIDPLDLMGRVLRRKV